MYNSQEIAGRIRARAKQQNMPLGELLSSCGLGVNTVSKISNGTDILTLNFAKIADKLNCSVDYLLGRTDIPEVNTLDNMVRIYTAARSRDGDTYGEAEVQTVRQSLIDRLRAAPDASDDL